VTRVRIIHRSRIGIGEATAIFGMTARAIRFYEQRGLIALQRDRTNARVFDHAARRRLAWIGELRRAGVSLADIAEILESEETSGLGWERATAHLEARQERLQKQLEDVSALLRDISRLKAERSSVRALRPL
jgi:DNA-binding transcriptional MerR regulator